ncbi:prephenate dehydrogenase [Staphylococcus agnetis]|uniref:prephenate dehydrogenase n=1 Tax=Staphylococcus agnetis TaxID=985762 RepID=UPI0007219670|nr:prephenate dehydrogenase [Staphylococcus agnetis]ALN76380.1 prephenate dehydrogenase [Staphylococcus agnetis]
MTNIFFVGLGLIGGSLASNFKYFYEDIHITAYDANHHQLQRAISMGVVDTITTNYAHGLAQADIVIFATPVQTTTAYLKEMSQYETRPGLIVTDTGSTKSTIQAFERSLLKHDIHLIGGHPMAGSHKSGVLNAKKHLFENAYYVLVHDLPENNHASEKIQSLLQYTRAKVISMTADEHDKITGIVSHVPHFVASSLVHLNALYARDSEWVKDLAAGGFRDITRIASSNPEMWRDISLENTQHILTVMKQLRSQFDDVITLLESQDANGLYAFFNHAKMYHDELPLRNKGAMNSTFDLYVDIPDKPGTISQVLDILSTRRISISNLRILEVREDIYGALRISFKSASDRDAGRQALSHQFDTYIN